MKIADVAKDEDRSAYAVSCLTEMFVQTKRIDEVFLIFRDYPGDTPARYDLRLNVNLMQGAELLKGKRASCGRFAFLLFDDDYGRNRCLLYRKTKTTGNGAL